MLAQTPVQSKCKTTCAIFVLLGISTWRAGVLGDIEKHSRYIDMSLEHERLTRILLFCSAGWLDKDLVLELKCIWGLDPALLVTARDCGRVMESWDRQLLHPAKHAELDMMFGTDNFQPHDMIQGLLSFQIEEARAKCRLG
jgi:hypothetical protein